VRRRRRITHARLLEVLHYDSETGEFRWLEAVSRLVKPGDLAGRTSPGGYRHITIKGITYPAHQLAWFYMTGKWCRVVVDHRDCDPSNNRWDNLRRATQSQNCANRCRPKNNACGFKGVHLIPSGRWRATVWKKGRKYDLGIFATPEEAHAAYMEKARKLYGEFARAA
jgi:hypothetical protein